MRRVWIGLIVGMLITAPWTEAFRVGKPPTSPEWTASFAAQLNTFLESLWQVTNGRYTFDVTTTNPNGSRVGTQGDAVFYNANGSYKFCVNTSSTTPSSTTGTTWRCAANAFTVP